MRVPSLYANIPYIVAQQFKGLLPTVSEANVICYDIRLVRQSHRRLKRLLDVIGVPLSRTIEELPPLLASSRVDTLNVLRDLADEQLILAEGLEAAISEAIDHAEHLESNASDADASVGVSAAKPVVAFDPIQPFSLRTLYRYQQRMAYCLIQAGARVSTTMGALPRRISQTGVCALATLHAVAYEQVVLLESLIEAIDQAVELARTPNMSAGTTKGTFFWPFKR